MTRETHDMTPEVAAEIILRANPFTPCVSCGGEGRNLLEVSVQHHRGKPDIEVETFELCGDCNASGRAVHTDYAIACAVLDRELPMAPPKKRALPRTLRRINIDPVGPPMKVTFGKGV